MDKQNRAARKKYHIIYKTTCLVTGKYYIGMHSTDNLTDGYMGSGKRLWQSIKKHGAEQHICEVLEELPSREALRAREAELVNKQLLEDKLCMNIALGGEGGWEHENARKTKDERSLLGKLGGYANQSFERRSRLAKIHKPWIHFTNKHHTTETKLKLSISAKTNPRPNPMLGKKHSEETKQKIREKVALQQFPTGWNHSEETKQKLREIRKKQLEE